MANSVWVGFLGSARVTTSGNDVVFPGTLSATALLLGTNHAAAGIIRIPNSQTIRARNAANSADIEMIGTTSSNFVELSGSGASVRSGGILFPVSPLDLGLLASPWANVYATAYFAGGTAGIDFNGAVTNLTVVKGIVTAAS